MVLRLSWLNQAFLVSRKFWDVITKEAPKQVFFVNFLNSFRIPFYKIPTAVASAKTKIGIWKFTSSFKQTNTNIHRQEHTT